MKPRRAPPARALVGLLAGARLAQAISVAARLGLADLLDAGPRTPAELAASTGTDADALHRMLRALAGAGIFEEEAGGRFRLDAACRAAPIDSPRFDLSLCRDGR